MPENYCETLQEWAKKIKLEQERYENEILGVEREDGAGTDTVSQEKIKRFAGQFATENKAALTKSKKTKKTMKAGKRTLRAR